MVQNAVASRHVPPKAKKPKGKKPIRVNYYLPVDLVTRVDTYAAKLAAEDKLGRPVTRTDAIRLLIATGLKTEGIE
jgi:hypothetical protein